MNEKEFATSLTEGVIWKQILMFALPLFMGQLFQQLYNVVDTLIVGNFLGKEPLAAISTTGPVIFLMVGLFNGMAIGSGVVVARYYGEKNIPMLRKAVHTILIFSFCCGIFLTIFGVTFIDDILQIMKTPEEVLPLSIAYFQVYFMGSVAFVVYNYSVGILQSVGDSKHPLYYLIISSVLNVILDLFFIAVLHKGIASAAFATIISQFVSATLCLIRLFLKSPDEYRIRFSELRIDTGILKLALKNGIPTGLQNSVISIANMLKLIPRIEVVFSAYPLTWMISMTIFLFYYFKTDWVHGYPKSNVSI